MKQSILLIVALFFFSFFSSVFAIDAPTGLRVSESNEDSITIDWESVPGAIGYYHYIGDESGVYTDGIDLIDTTEYTIPDINPDEVYYIAITSVDEFGEESIYSEEIVYSDSINPVVSSGGFRVSNVEVLDPTTLQVEFSRQLNSDTSSIREFAIENKGTGIETGVVISQVDDADNSMILVLLDSDLQEDSEYELTVLDIEDVDGNTIESGIDAFISFMTPKSFSSSQEETEDETFGLESAGTGSTNTNDDNSSENESNSNEEVNTGETGSESNSDESVETEVGSFNSANINQGNAGVTISSTDISNNTTETAEENTSLPQTGPEHWLLALIAVLLSAGVFYRIQGKK